MMKRLKVFSEVKKVYDKMDTESLEKGILPMHSTDDGFWGTSNIDMIYDFFVKIKLENFKNFLDLGSGDGRVALVASAFTKSIGIETDKELIERGVKIRDKLCMKASFIKKNYMDIDFGDYDFIYIFPDKRFSPELEKKLKKELEGSLFVYNSIYLPYFLKKRKTWWIDQFPIIEYVR